jgi:hypothetical protein
MKLGNSLDAAGNEILNALLQNLAVAPSNPGTGQVYFDTVRGQFGIFTGSIWIYLADANVSRSGDATADGVMQVSGGADKTIRDFASAGGIVKVSATGVVSLAVTGVDFVTPSGTETLTNKTINASANLVTNLTVSNFGAGVVDTDTLLASNSDTKIPSQKAVKGYIDQKTLSSVVLIGGIDASTNPNYPAAEAGHQYRVTVAGRIGGATGEKVTAGDVIECYVAGPSGTQATVGANWSIVQSNVDQATESTLGLTQFATPAEASAKSVSTKAVTPAGLVDYTKKVTANIGNGSSTQITVTDNLGTIDKIAEVRDASTNDKVLVDIKYANNTTIFTFSVAPALNSYRVTIIG